MSWSCRGVGKKIKIPAHPTGAISLMQAFTTIDSWALPYQAQQIAHV